MRGSGVRISLAAPIFKAFCEAGKMTLNAVSAA
jgi:hypothetical protein